MHEISATPITQFPLRLHNDLAARLSHISEITGINKSTILRMGTVKILNELESSGVTEKMTRLSES